jgi:murein DD-endopeptidase MepM/ murein hydrolase activator NlpD
VRAGLHRPISDEDREDVAGETRASTKSTHTPPVGPDLGRLGFGDRDGDTPRGLEMPLAAGDVPTISPRMTAVFGGLFGLATVASIVALLIQIFPVTDQRSIAAQATTEAQEVQAPEAAPAKPKKRERQLLSSPWRVDELKDTHLVVRGKMERRAFITALSEAGVPKAEVYRVLKAMEGVRKFDRTGKYDTFVVAMARGTKKVMAFEYRVDKTEIYQARTGDDGLLKGDRLDMKVRHDEVAASIYIGKDFVKSYERVGLEPGLSEVINDAFLGRISTESFEEGGVLKLVVVETTALGAFVGYERIRAVEYRPPDPAKEPVRAYWFEGERSKGYVDDRGRRPTNKGWRTPTPGAPITSHFNPTRMHPVLKKVMPHNGTDFGAPSGTPVYAAFRGTVTAVGMHGASGNLVLIDHPGGIQTGYAHLSRFASGIKVGDKVGVRQLIGYVGSTGRSTGPHLHFSAKRDGKFFDALELKLDALEVLPVEERALFLQQKSQLDGVLEAMPLPDPPEPEPAPADDPPSDPFSEEESAESEGDRENDPESDPERDEGAARPPGKSADEDLGGDLLGEDLSGDIE